MAFSHWVYREFNQNLDISELRRANAGGVNMANLSMGRNRNIIPKSTSMHDIPEESKTMENDVKEH